MKRCLLLLLLTTGCRPDDWTGDTGWQVGPGDTTPGTDGSTDGDTDGDTDGSTDGDTDGGTDGSTDGGGADGACAGLAIVGDWVSEGGDISPLFQSSTVDYTRIEATFAGDCTYTVTATKGGGGVDAFAGTWTGDDGTSPASIVQTQEEPVEDVVSEGIWEVAGDTLTFEVVVTSPDYGFTAPTPATGFGSTAGQGLSAGDNTQVYRRD